MHRQPLLDLLDQYLRRYPAEGDTTLRYRDFVQRNPLCFERSLAEGHVTASAWILNAEGDKTLLTHHRKLNLWLQPGGHADGDSDVLAVAMQECLEETGLHSLTPVHPHIFDLDIHGIPAHKDVPAHYHYDVRFLVRHTGSGEFIVSEESHDLAWVPLDQLEDYTTEWSMRRMRDKALRST
jgi:8-oxo-dGTP pyrophosphatase MutT (NUDIX family)